MLLNKISLNLSKRVLFITMLIYHFHHLCEEVVNLRKIKGDIALIDIKSNYSMFD